MCSGHDGGVDDCHYDYVAPFIQASVVEHGTNVWLLRYETGGTGTILGGITR